MNRYLMVLTLIFLVLTAGLGAFVFAQHVRYEALTRQLEAQLREVQRQARQELELLDGQLLETRAALEQSEQTRLDTEKRLNELRTRFGVKE